MLKFKSKIVPVIVITDEASALPLGRCLVENGMPVAEVTLRTPAALSSIRRMCEVPGLQVGAGTVLTVDQATAAVDAGACFLVSPGLHEDVIRYAQSVNVPIIPGIATPSEMARAISLGLDLVKFFPAEALGGVRLLKAIGSVYPDVAVMPTGGISPSNISGYLDLPNVVACGGSWMIPASELAAGDFEKIGELVRAASELTK